MLKPRFPHPVVVLEYPLSAVCLVVVWEPRRVVGRASCGWLERQIFLPVAYAVRIGETSAVMHTGVVSLSR